MGSRRLYKYSRAKKKEEKFYWMELFNADKYRYWDDYDEYGAWGIDWYDYAGSGTVKSMTEYHTMHILTLLHRLSLISAKRLLMDYGWYTHEG